MTALQVNECRVFATQSGAAWWGLFRHQYRNSDRITTITASLGGDLVQVRCEDLEHADWLAQTAKANGIPASALKVIR